MLKLCKNGLFKNRALILSPSVQWRLFDHSCYYYLEPIGARLPYAQAKDTFIFEGSGNGFFHIEHNKFFIGNLPSHKKYDIIMFNYRGKTLLIFTYNYNYWLSSTSSSVTFTSWTAYIS